MKKTITVKDSHLHIRIDADDKAVIARNAARFGLPLAEYARRVLLNPVLNGIQKALKGAK